MNSIEYSGRCYSTSNINCKARVLVCTLSARDPVAAFTECKENAIFHSLVHGLSVQTLNVRSSAVAQSRNLCVEQLKTRDWNGYPPDYLLFLDDDMIFPDEIITQLVQASEQQNAGVVGVLATGKAPPFPICVLDRESNKALQAEQAFAYHQKNEVKEVGAVGMACTLIRAEIFQDLEAPYFSFYHHLDEVAEEIESASVAIAQGDLITPEALRATIKKMRYHLVGEDYSFCIKARDKGWKVYCDFGVTTPFQGRELPGIGHVGTYPFSLIDSLSFTSATPAKPIESEGL